MKQFGVAVLVVGAFVLTPHAAPAAESTVGQELGVSDLYEIYDVDQVPGDFIVVIDTSGSMQADDDPLYPAVVDAVGALVQAIPEGDYLSLLTFDADVRSAWTEPVTADSRDEVVAALPEVADGQSTDLGAAIAGIVDRIERPAAATVQTVVLMTDGRHEPPPGSAFPADTSSGQWPELFERARALGENQAIRAYGVALGDGNATDVDLLRQAFGRVQIAAQPTDQLPAFFAEVVERARLDRLQALVIEDLEVVETDLGQPEVVDTGTETVIDVPVTLGSLRVPASVEVTNVTATDGEGQPVDAEVVEATVLQLQPGETGTVRVRVGVDSTTPGGLVVGEQRADLDFDVDVSTRVVAQPSDILVDTVEVDPVVSTSGASSGIATVTWGIPWRTILIVIGGLLALLALFLFLWLRYWRTPGLQGRLVFEDGTSIRLRGKERRVPEAQEEIPGTGRSQVQLLTRRGEPGKVYVQPLHGSVSLFGGSNYGALRDTVRLRRDEPLKIGQATARLQRR